MVLCVAQGAPEILDQCYNELQILTRLRRIWAPMNRLAEEREKSPPPPSSPPVPPSPASSSGSLQQQQLGEAPTAKAPVADIIGMYAEYLEMRVAFHHKVSTVAFRFLSAVAAQCVVWCVLQYSRYEGNFSWGQYLLPIAAVLQPKGSDSKQNTPNGTSGYSSSSQSVSYSHSRSRDTSQSHSHSSGGHDDSDDDTPAVSGRDRDAQRRLLETNVEWFTYVRDLRDDSAVPGLLVLCGILTRLGLLVLDAEIHARLPKPVRLMIVVVFLPMLVLTV